MVTVQSVIAHFYDHRRGQSMSHPKFYFEIKLAVAVGFEPTAFKLTV